MLPTNFEPLQTPKEKLQAKQQAAEGSGWGTAATLGGLALASPLLYKGAKMGWNKLDRPFEEYLDPLKKAKATAQYVYDSTIGPTVNKTANKATDFIDDAIVAEAYAKRYRDLNAPTFGEAKNHYALADELATIHGEASGLNPRAIKKLQKQYRATVNKVAAGAFDKPWVFKNATLTPEQKNPFEIFLLSQKNKMENGGVDLADQKLFNEGITPDMLRFMVQHSSASPEHMDELLYRMRQNKK